MINETKPDNKNSKGYEHIYISINYFKHNNVQEITKNATLLMEKSQSVIANEILHMGDFNSRTFKTGDHAENNNGKILDKILTKKSFKIMTNPGEKKPTFARITTINEKKTKVTSIIDHFITKEESTKFKDYKVMSNRLNSPHFLISIGMQMLKTATKQTGWGKEEMYTYMINETHKRNIKKYKKNLELYAEITPESQEDNYKERINPTTNRLIDIIIQSAEFAKQKIVNKDRVNPRMHDSTKTSKIIERLIKKDKQGASKQTRITRLIFRKKGGILLPQLKELRSKTSRILRFVVIPKVNKPRSGP
jgi:hypothetical protein